MVVKCLTHAVTDTLQYANASSVVAIDGEHEVQDVIGCFQGGQYLAERSASGKKD